MSTHWTTVFNAGHADPSAAHRALEKLCNAYWSPLFEYVRRQGQSVADAQDLTQEFFARFLERQYVQLADKSRGRFRTFLLTSLRHFIVNEWNKTNALKRGGGHKPLSLDEEREGKRPGAEPAVEQAPDAVFDQGWASALLQRAMDRLDAEFAADGKRETFEQLKIFLWGTGEPVVYAVLAEKLGMNEGALKTAVSRFRGRFREHLRLEVAQTVSAPGEIEEELRYLRSVVSGQMGDINPGGC